jgi:hypothetical protein
MDETTQIGWVKYAPSNIKKIFNPSEAVQLAAVKRDGTAIRWIHRPTNLVKLEAVKKSPQAILYIKKPSEELQLLAINKSVEVLQYIVKPSEFIQMEAIKKDRRAYIFIKDFNIIKNSKQYWDNNDFHYYLSKKLLPLTEEQYQEVLEDYNTLQLFK